MAAIDRTSETWIAIKAWSDAEHDKAMMVLKRATSSEADTQFARGVVNLIEELRDLAQPKAPGPVARKIPPYA